MKEQFKKVLSGFLAFLLLFGAINWSRMITRAEVEKNEETVSLEAVAAKNMIANGFYFDTTCDTGEAGDPLAYNSDWSVRYGQPEAAEGGVYVNGDLTQVQLIKLDAGRYYVALSDKGYSGTKGMEVVIDGIYCDAEDKVTFEKTRFVYNGVGWNQDISDKLEDMNTVTVSLEEQPDYNKEKEGFYFQTVSGTGAIGDPLTYNTNWSVRYTPLTAVEGGVYVNGQLTSVQLIKIAEGRYYVALSDSGISGTKGMDVVIDATYYDEEDAVTFEKTRFVYFEDGWKQNKITASIEEDRGFNMNANGFYFETSTDEGAGDPLAYDTKWKVRYEPKNTVEGGVYVDGNLTHVNMLKIGPGRYYVALSDLGYIGTKGMEVVIDATCYDEENVVTLEKTRFVFNGVEWMQNKVTVSIAEDAPFNMNANGFYFETSTATGAGDPLAYNSDWSVRYTPSKALKGGVYVNGNPTDVDLIKTGPGRYYVALSDLGFVGTKGMEVVIDAIYYDAEDAVAFKKTKFEYDGLAWKQDISDKIASMNKVKVSLEGDAPFNMNANGFFFFTVSKKGEIGDPLAFNSNWSVRYSTKNAVEGGVYVNGTLTEVEIMKLDAGRYYVALSDLGFAGTKGMEVVIDATYYDAEDVVTFKRARFVYDGLGWKQDISDKIEKLKKVTVSIEEDREFNMNDRGFFFYTISKQGQVGDPFAYNKDWSVRYGQTEAYKGGVYVNGELTEVQLIKLDVGRYYVALSDLGYSGVKGMEVVIDGIYYDAENAITFKKTKFVYDGIGWKQDISDKLEKLNKVTVTLEEDRGFNMNERGFYFETTSADGKAGDPFAYNKDWSVRYGQTEAYKGGVYVNGELTEVQLIKLDVGRYYVALSDLGFVGTAGMEVVIDATYYDAENVVTFKKTKFVYDGVGWKQDISDKLAKLNKVTVTLEEDRGFNMNERGFYFETTSADGKAGDPFAYNDKWTARYGQTNVYKGGVYVNGKLTQVDLIKIGPGRYYVALSDLGYSGVKGMEVVIDATYYDAENVVTFKKTKFVYDGVGWKQDISDKIAKLKQVTVSLQEQRPYNLNPNGFYFQTISPNGDIGDPFAYNDKWTARYGQEQSYKGGVYVNGELTQVQLIKIDVGRYYVALSDLGFVGTKGMEVVIDATYYDAKNAVTFKRTKFVYTGRWWQQEGAEVNDNLKGLVQVGEISTADIYDYAKTYSISAKNTVTTQFASAEKDRNVSLRMKVNVNADAHEMLFGMGKDSLNMWGGEGYQFWLCPANGTAVIKIGKSDAVAYGAFDPSGEFILEIGIVDVNKNGKYYGVKAYIKINGEEVVAYAETKEAALRISGTNILYYIPEGVRATFSTTYDLKELPVTYMVDGTEKKDCELVEVPGVLMGKPFYYTISKKSGETTGVKDIKLMLNGTEVQKVGRNSNSYTFKMPEIHEGDTLTVEVQTAELTTDAATIIYDIYEATGVAKSGEKILGKLCEGDQFSANSAVQFILNIPENYKNCGFGLATKSSNISNTNGYSIWFSETGVELCNGLNGQPLSFASSKLFKSGSSVYVECGIVKCYENGVYKYDRVYVKAGTTLKSMKLLTWYDSTNRGGYYSGLLSNGVGEYCSLKKVYSLMDNSLQIDKDNISKVYYQPGVLAGESAKIMLYPVDGMKVTQLMVGNKLVKPTKTKDGAYIYVIGKVTGDISFSYKTGRE